jgi:hypothetical protein
MVVKEANRPQTHNLRNVKGRFKVFGIYLPILAFGVFAIESSTIATVH